MEAESVDKPDRQKFDLGERLLEYAVRIIRVVEALPQTRGVHHGFMVLPGIPAALHLSLRERSAAVHRGRERGRQESDGVLHRRYRGDRTAGGGYCKCAMRLSRLVPPLTRPTALRAAGRPLPKGEVNWKLSSRVRISGAD